MKRSSIIFILFLTAACQFDDIKPVNKIEANLGIPFIVSAPAEVSFKENGFTLYIERFGSFIHYGIVSANTIAVIHFEGRKIDLYHSLYCDTGDCEGGYAYDEDTFAEEASLNEQYKLKFQKITATSVIKEDDDGRQTFRVDSAQFLITGYSP